MRSVRPPEAVALEWKIPQLSLDRKNRMEAGRMELVAKPGQLQTAREWVPKVHLQTAREWVPPSTERPMSSSQHLDRTTSGLTSLEQGDELMMLKARKQMMYRLQASPKTFQQDKNIPNSPSGTIRGLEDRGLVETISPVRKGKHHRFRVDKGLCESSTEKCRSTPRKTPNEMTGGHSIGMPFDIHAKLNPWMTFSRDAKGNMFTPGIYASSKRAAKERAQRKLNEESYLYAIDHHHDELRPHRGFLDRIRSDKSRTAEVAGTFLEGFVW